MTYWIIAMTMNTIQNKIMQVMNYRRLSEDIENSCLLVSKKLFRLCNCSEKMVNSSLEYLLSTCEQWSEHMLYFI